MNDSTDYISNNFILCFINILNNSKKALLILGLAALFFYQIIIFINSIRNNRKLIGLKKLIFTKSFLFLYPVIILQDF